MNLRYHAIFQTYKRLYGALPRSARPSADGGRRVMLYHDVAATPSPWVEKLGITMSPSDFEAHLGYLVETYRVVPFSRIFDEPDGSGALAVTFDDGLRSIVNEVLPIIERLACPIKVYLNGTSLDGGLTWLNKLSYLLSMLDDAGVRELNAVVSTNPTRRRVSPFIDAFTHEVEAAIDRAYARVAPEPAPQLFLTRDDVRRLAGHPLVELGSHTRSHYPLNRLSEAELRDEVAGFHAELVREFGDAIDGFCVPFGYLEHITPAVVRAVAEVDRRVVTAYGGRVDTSEIHGVPEVRRVAAWGNLGVLWHQLVVHS